MRPSREQVGHLLEALVRTPSPSGQEAEACQVLLDHLAAWGLEAWQDEAGNVHAARGPEGAPRVLLLGHIDTVPGQVPVRWEDGVLWGRGAVDAKGPLVSHALALASLEAPELRVELVAAVGEETTSPGAFHLAEGPEPSAVIIAEPTGLDTVGLGYKGCLRGRLVAEAEPTHPASGQATAAELALEAIDQLTAWTGNPARDPSVGETTVRVTKLTTVHEAQAEQAVAELDLRFPGPVPDLGPVEADLPPGVRLEMGRGLPGVRAERRGPVATALRGGILSEGGAPRAAVKTGSSDWNVVARRWRCPIAAYGPGDSSLDHTPDEHLPLDELLAAGRRLTAALAGLAEQLHPPTP